jgi:hypothetical protein
MSDFIGILELIGWLVLVAAVAAGFTFGVTRLVPSKDKPTAGSASSSDAS